MKKALQALRANYLPAFLILLLALCDVQTANSQQLQPVPGYGFQWNRGRMTTLFGLPTDTLPVTGLNQTYPWLASKNNQLYKWNTSTLFWQAAAGTGGGSVDSVTFSQSINVDTVKYWIAGTAYVAGVVDVKCGLITPGTVVYDSLLSFTVSPSIHRSCLDGIRYTTTLSHVTLSPADGTFDRFDIIALEGSSVVVVEGDPSATPALPQLTPGQTYLTFISVPATATVPDGVSTATIYDENTEFTVTSSAVTTNADNRTNVHHFLKSVDAGAVGLLSEIYFTGADFKISNYTSLRFFIKLKSSFSNTTRLLISWLRDGVAQSSTVVLANNTYGYSRTNTTTYQEIIIPVSDFSFFQDTVDALRIKFSGSNANGFYFDWATLTGGIPQTSPQPNGFGTVQTQGGAAVSTQPNDVLNIVGAGGITTSATGKTVTITAPSPIDTANKWIQSIWRVPGIDSIYYTKGGVVFAIKDSTGAGGSTPTLQQVFDAETGEALMNKNDTINLSTFRLFVNGSNTTSVATIANSSSFGTALTLNPTNGYGLIINGAGRVNSAAGATGFFVDAGSNGIGYQTDVSGSSGTGYYSNMFGGGLPFWGVSTNSSTNTVISTLVLGREVASGVGANGVGQKIRFTGETSASSSVTINEIVSTLVDANNGTRTSRADIIGISNVLLDTLIGLGGYVNLTESSATKFTSTTIATGKIQGGQILVTVEANDATDYQSRTLRFIWSAVNKAGTLTITIGTPEEVVALSSGTLTATITGVDAGSGVLDFKIDAASSLTQSTLRATYQKFKNF